MDRRAVQRAVARMSGWKVAAVLAGFGLSVGMVAAFSQTSGGAISLSGGSRVAGTSGVSADRIDPGDALGSSSSTTTASTTTTTMPPRAQPVRLAPTESGPLDGTVIVVDPGHNGLNYRYTDVKRAGSLDGDGPTCNSAGASTVAGLDEMVINWEIGTRLSTLLRRLGAEVVLTHPDLEGFGPCADERGFIASQANATAFISIHADGSATGGSGFHIIHPAPKETLDVDAVNASRRLAEIVRDQLVFIGGRPANYVGANGIQQRDDLANLNTANRPAILAELGNLRNGLDASMLSTKTTYDQIARALVRSVLVFVGRPPDLAALSVDVNGDGLIDFLSGAPQLATTTTTTTTTTPSAPVLPEPEPPSSPSDTSSPSSDPTTDPAIAGPPG